jgi:hypothetical protein
MIPFRSLAAAACLSALACIAQPNAAYLQGQAEDFAALDAIIAAQNPATLRDFASGFRSSTKPTPAANAQIQQRIVASWDRDPYVSELLAAARAIDDKRLVELILADVTALARWRAERRKTCTIGVVALHTTPGKGDVPAYSSYALGQPAAVEIFHETRLSNQAYRKIDWRFVCSKPNPAEPATDLDGRPNNIVTYVNGTRRATHWLPRRDAESLKAIGRVATPGIGKPLAPLLVDLSLPPPVAWDKAGKPAQGIAFPPLQVPTPVLTILAKEKVTPGAAAVAKILDEYEKQLPAPWAANDEQWTISALLGLAIQDGSAEGMQLLGKWLPLIAASPDQSSREFMLATFVWKIGTAPSGQVDLAKVKREVLGALPYADVSKYSFMFDQAQRSVRPPVNASPAAR